MSFVELYSGTWRWENIECLNIGIKKLKYILCIIFLLLNRFLDKVNSYLAEMSPDGLLAVHCTHGLNRTGYLVCR